jgi:hypothetical protein
MAELVFFHQAQGLAPGVVAFADPEATAMPAQRVLAVLRTR